MKKFKLVLAMTMISMLVTSCGGFKAKRVDAQESDEKALEITDNWLQKDSEDTVKEIIATLKNHKGYKSWLARKRGTPKLFIAEVQNRTAEAYFPIDDMNDELLNALSETGEFVLIDQAARESILKEITYQNDGMVDPASAKSVGKQTGADLMIFGSVNMKPEKRDGKTIKQYSVNIRMTDIEKAEEVFRARTKTSKFSEKSSFGL